MTTKKHTSNKRTAANSRPFKKLYGKKSKKAPKKLHRLPASKFNPNNVEFDVRIATPEATSKIAEQLAPNAHRIVREGKLAAAAAAGDSTRVQALVDELNPGLSTSSVLGFSRTRNSYSIAHRIQTEDVANHVALMKRLYPEGIGPDRYADILVAFVSTIDDREAAERHGDKLTLAG